MSDDLIKRLRKRQEFEFIDGYKRIEWEDEDALEAADYIERLEANYIEACEEAAECYMRQCIAERKLAKAVEALRMVVGYYDKVNPFRTADYHREDCACDRCYFDDAGATLAELEGKE